jgi:DNA-binding CsgD family transcriptional regulator
MGDELPIEQRLAGLAPGYTALYPDLIERLKAAQAAGNPELQAAADALLRAYEAMARRQEALLVSRFELTPAQARLAAHIRDGGGLADYATASGIKESTARQHLKLVFQKLGVRRQAELVARLRDSG